MSWQGEIGIMVRHLVGDVDPCDYIYNTERIETTILVAAQLVLLEIDFETTYIVDVEQGYLNPDPTDPTTAIGSSNRDDGFINLTAMKAACLILNSELRTHALNAVRVSDGPSSIDYTAVATNIKSLYDAVCLSYQNYKYDFAAGKVPAGKAIISPYAPGSDVVYRYTSDSRQYIR